MKNRHILILKRKIFYFAKIFFFSLTKAKTIHLRFAVRMIGSIVQILHDLKYVPEAQII